MANGDEVAIGSNVNSADSDGDGASDAEEVRLGYDPLDRSNRPPAATTLVSLLVSPPSLNLSVNSVLGQTPAQLTVTGLRSDDTTVNLTAAPGTTYESLDEAVAVVDDAGQVVGIANGSTAIRVRNGNLSADVAVSVSVTDNIFLGVRQMPGYANNVDVSGEHVYVAAGAAGLQVVRFNPNGFPRTPIVGSLDTPGNANDVRIAGNRAYVADGSCGLQIINVGNPGNPSLLASLDTPGNAQDVVIDGNRAYVADGASGLHIIDITNPGAPVLLGSVDTPGTARGVAVSGNIAVVADDTKPDGDSDPGSILSALSEASPPNALRVIDISDPASAGIVGSVILAGNAKDVAVRDRLAYVACEFGGLSVVDFSLPAKPVLVNGIPANGSRGFFPRDLELKERYSVVADKQYQSRTPLLDLEDPTDPRTLGLLDFSNAGTFHGTGVAMDEIYVYSTQEYLIGWQENGTTGNTWLFIGQYRVPEAGTVSDNAGVAPTATITGPQAGQTVLEGSRLGITVSATDDVRVAGVRFAVNGNTVVTDVVAPYQITYTVPLGMSGLVVEATAFDLAGNTGAAAPVTLGVLPDPPPTISIVTPAEGEELYEGQSIWSQAQAEDNGGIAQIVFTVNGETLPPYYPYYVIPMGTTSLTVEATATDNLGHTASTTRTVNVVPDPPPTITLMSPAEGAGLIEGQTIELAAESDDNFGVSQVVFAVNGVVLPVNYYAPYRQSYIVPEGTTSLTVEATATDYLGQTSSISRTFTVVPNAGTNVNGRVVDTSGQPVADATVSVFNQFTAQTAADGSFSVAGVATLRGDVLARVTATIDGTAAANASLPHAPVVGGVTDVGIITLSILPTAPSVVVAARLDGSYTPSLLVGYADRQSLVYQFNGGQFAPSSSIEVPFGAATSGAGLVNNYSSSDKIVVQLAGQPGSVMEVSGIGGNGGGGGQDFAMAASGLTGSIGTGLEGESEYTAAGHDTNVYPNREVVAFLGRTTTGETALNVFFAASSSGGSDRVDTLEAKTNQARKFAAASGSGVLVNVPVDPSAHLRSLTLADVTGDGLLDILAIRKIDGSDGRLVVLPRTSETTFGAAIESPVTIRSAVAGRAVNDFAIGTIYEASIVYIYVLGDDAVRLYKGSGTGAFTPDGELTLPSGRVPTGIGSGDVSSDSRTDVLVTTRDAYSSDAKSLLGYVRTPEGAFGSPVIRQYVAPASIGDTRIVLGEWQDFDSLDAVVVDGQTVIFFQNVGPCVPAQL